MSFLMRISLILLGFILAISSVTSGEDAVEFVRKSCNEKLDFKLIAEFKIFISHYKKVIESGFVSDVKEDKLLSRCLEEKDSILALEELIAGYDKKRPCKWQEISKLEDYAHTHLFDRKKRPMSLKFYTLFGVNIGFICKKNLLAHVNQADTEVDQVDFIYSMASPIGWQVLINEYTKKSMKFGSSTNAEGALINRIAKLIPGLTGVEQLDYMNFNHSMNSITIKDWQGIEKSSYKSANQDQAAKLVDSVSKIVDSCQRLDQFYFNSTLSLARLKNLGLLVSFDRLNGQHENSLMLHKWLAATSFCQLMVRIRVKKLEENEDTIGIEIIHKDSLLETRRKLYSYVSEFDDISSDAVEKAWSASVPDGNWCRKDKAIFKQTEGSEVESLAMKQFKQFIKGLERDYLAFSRANE